MPYAGISVGWQAGLAGPDVAAPIFTIEHNHVHDFGLGILSDFAGVYLSTNDNLCFQKDPMTCYLPTLVHNNLIEDCAHYNYGCNASLKAGTRMRSRTLTGCFVQDSDGLLCPGL